MSGGIIPKLLTSCPRRHQCSSFGSTERSSPGSQSSQTEIFASAAIVRLSFPVTLNFGILCCRYLAGKFSAGLF
jgi:hypothetical protein